MITSSLGSNCAHPRPLLVKTAWPPHLLLFRLHQRAFLLALLATRTPGEGIAASPVKKIFSANYC